jgi:hypothetical protein
MCTWVCSITKFLTLQRSNFLQRIYKNSVRTSQKTHYFSPTKPNRLVLFREKNAVYCKNHMTHTNTPCKQNAKCWYVKAGGTYSNHWPLKGYEKEKNFTARPQLNTKSSHTDVELWPVELLQETISTRIDKRAECHRRHRIYVISISVPNFISMNIFFSREYRLRFLCVLCMKWTHDRKVVYLCSLFHRRRYSTHWCCEVHSENVGGMQLWLAPMQHMPFFNSWGGITPSPLGMPATSGRILQALDDIWIWSIWCNENFQGKSKYSEKTCPSTTLSTTNPT